MQAADPDRQRIRELRRRIAEQIEADVALLDADCDIEVDDGVRPIPVAGGSRQRPRPAGGVAIPYQDALSAVSGRSQKDGSAAVSSAAEP